MADPAITARGGRPTLESVAAHAAVSRQTVSNALNAPHLVAPQTLTRVQHSISALRYHPHRAARQLRTSRSHVIGLRLEPVRDGINGSVLDRFLHALTERAQEVGYCIQLFTAGDDAAETRTHAELLDSAQVDGFVLTSTHHGDPRTAWLARRGVPFSVFGRPWGEPAPVHPWVDVDGAAGTRAATKYLVEAGHRGIAFIGWPPGSGVGDDRREGWRQALLAAGLPASLVHERRIPDSVDAGERAAAALLSGPDAPTALVCASDSLAFGALPVARAAGCSIVGFDDTPVAAAVGLSSVRQPLEQAARACLRHVLDGLDAPGRSGQVDLLVPRIVVRTSSFGPPGRDDAARSEPQPQPRRNR